MFFIWYYISGVDMTMYHSVALLAVFCPSFGNDPFEGSAFQASLDLPKIRNLQMDHFALIRYVEIPEIVPDYILFDIPPFRGQRNRHFWNPIWVRSYGTEPNFYTFDIRIEIRFDERIYVYNFIGFMYPPRVERFVKPFLHFVGLRLHINCQLSYFVWNE